MRSLFVKTLLWFLATTAIAISAITFTTALSFKESESRQSPFTMLLKVQVEDAKRAYESGGRLALASVMARFQNVTQGEVVFTNSDGYDLVTGQLRPDLKNRMSERERRHGPPLFPQFYRRAVIARPDAAHKYWLFLIDNRNSASLFWFLQPQHLWIIGMVVLLCYAFAYHLTSPVRRLQKAVDCFGRGELSVRAETKRRDELGQLARTFNQMADRIQTLLKAERRLLQDISHELRSPLARLALAVELARSGDDREVTLDRIQREAERLNELVSELLQVTRAEGDPSQQRMDAVQLEQVLTDIVYDSELEAKAKDVELALRADEPAKVLGDEELVRRAIENVVRNAIRYAPPHTAVEISLKRVAGKAEVKVRDYGPGVPEEALGRIFDAFYRVDTDRNRGSGGVGLGLSIARRAIQLHRGSLHAENLHPGLLVVAELPLAPARTGVEPKTAPAMVTS